MGWLRVQGLVVCNAGTRMQSPKYYNLYRKGPLIFGNPKPLSRSPTPQSHMGILVLLCEAFILSRRVLNRERTMNLGTYFALGFRVEGLRCQGLGFRGKCTRKV